NRGRSSLYSRRGKLVRARSASERAFPPEPKGDPLACASGSWHARPRRGDLERLFLPGEEISPGEEKNGGRTMKPRPRTTAWKKRIMKRKTSRRAGNKPSLGIPPKGKGWVGKKAAE